MCGVRANGAGGTLLGFVAAHLEAARPGLVAALREQTGRVAEAAKHEPAEAQQARERAE